MSYNINNQNSPDYLPIGLATIGFTVGTMIFAYFFNRLVQWNKDTSQTTPKAKQTTPLNAPVDSYTLYVKNIKEAPTVRLIDFFEVESNPAIKKEKAKPVIKYYLDKLDTLKAINELNLKIKILTNQLLETFTQTITSGEKNKVLTIQSKLESAKAKLEKLPKSIAPDTKHTYIHLDYINLNFHKIILKRLTHLGFLYPSPENSKECLTILLHIHKKNDLSLNSPLTEYNEKIAGIFKTITDTCQSLKTRCFSEFEKIKNKSNDASWSQFLSNYRKSMSALFDIFSCCHEFQPNKIQAYILFEILTLQTSGFRHYISIARQQHPSHYPFIHNMALEAFKKYIELLKLLLPAAKEIAEIFNINLKDDLFKYLQESFACIPDVLKIDDQQYIKTNESLREIDLKYQNLLLPSSKEDAETIKSYTDLMLKSYKQYADKCQIIGNKIAFYKSKTAKAILERLLKLEFIIPLMENNTKTPYILLCKKSVPSFNNSKWFIDDQTIADKLAKIAQDCLSMKQLINQNINECTKLDDQQFFINYLTTIATVLDKKSTYNVIKPNKIQVYILFENLLEVLFQLIIPLLNDSNIEIATEKNKSQIFHSFKALQCLIECLTLLSPEAKEILEVFDINLERDPSFRCLKQSLKCIAPALTNKKGSDIKTAELIKIQKDLIKVKNNFAHLFPTTLNKEIKYYTIEDGQLVSYVVPR